MIQCHNGCVENLVKYTTKPEKCNQSQVRILKMFSGMSQKIHQQNLHHEKSLQNLQPIKIWGYKKLCNKFFH